MHRIIDSGALTPWVEGNGTEIEPIPPGCAWVDPAYGVAWVGAGDGGDDNNQTQPAFDPEPVASAVVVQGVQTPGDVIRWDVTELAQAWLTGAIPNLGIVLVDPTSDGEQFKQIWFGARDGLLRGYTDPRVQPGPRLVLQFHD